MNFNRDLLDRAEYLAQLRSKLHSWQVYSEWSEELESLHEKVTKELGVVNQLIHPDRLILEVFK